MRSAEPDHEPADFAHRLLSAARSEPGDIDIAQLVQDAGVTGAASLTVIESVREAQLANVRSRRRTAELEALFSTARELVRLQDVDAVLDRLVQRAHELMGTDVTYLSEVENDAGDLRVRHSVGTVTPTFRDLVVPTGYGLASKVAQSREPAWVSRYRSMDEAPHDERIDVAVEAEGLVSFLGVPLTVGDEVLGVLFACNRFSYDYTPDEVLLLSAFADHAAAVLHTARVLEERANAIARTEHAYLELREHLAASELANRVHEELTAAIVSGATIVDLVGTMSRRLRCRVWALDADGRSLETTSGLPPRRHLLTAVSRSRASGFAEIVDADDRRWLVVAIPGSETSAGAIVAESVDPADDVARRTLERAAHAAALVSFKRDAVRAARAERDASWLLDVIERGSPSPGMPEPLSLCNGALTGCAVMDVRSRETGAALASAMNVIADDAVVAARDDHLILAWRRTDLMVATERTRIAVAERIGTHALVAVVRPVTHPSELRDAVDRALQDVRLLRPLGIEGATVASDALVPYHALASASAGAAVRFVDEIIGPVITWDRRRGTALFDTLVRYFQAGQRIQEVAADLNVHKNTVQQRLRRVQDLIVGDWTQPEYRFRLEAAVRLEQLRRSTRAAAVGLTDERTRSSSG